MNVFFLVRHFVGLEFPTTLSLHSNLDFTFRIHTAATQGLCARILNLPHILPGLIDSLRLWRVTPWSLVLVSFMPASLDSRLTWNLAQLDHSFSSIWVLTCDHSSQGSCFQGAQNPSLQWNYVFHTNLNFCKFKSLVGADFFLRLLYYFPSVGQKA